MIHYVKSAAGSRYGIEVYLNGMTEGKDVESDGEVLYSRNYVNGCLRKNGILILKRENQ